MNVHLVADRSDTILCRLWPQDKARNAGGRRRLRQGPAQSERGTPLAPPAKGLAPLLEEYLEEYAQQGLPAAYLPLAEDDFGAPEEESHSSGEDDAEAAAERGQG